MNMSDYKTRDDDNPFTTEPKGYLYNLFFLTLWTYTDGKHCQMEIIQAERERGEKEAVQTDDWPMAAASLNAGILQTFFHIVKQNWKKHPKPAVPDGELSSK